MTRNRITLLILTVALVVAGLVAVGRHPVKPVRAVQPAGQAPPIQAPQDSEPPPPAPAIQPVIRTEPVVKMAAIPSAPTFQPAPAKKTKEPLHDPDARIALSLVGTDPEAEAYWLEAIADPSLPDAEREDLMEDLNEDGLSDPKHPGPEDLPLIVNRIRIIEEIAPYSDDFMQEHLGEAYKDLVNLAAIAQGGGMPVQ